MKIIFVILLFSFWILTVNASTYYVRTDGNDSNAGTADNAGGAKLTCAGAAAVTSAPGDIVHVRAGTYTESFTESTSGSAGNLINWIFDSPATTILRGQMTISGDYVRLLNAQITHATDLGAIVRGVHITGDHCEILDCSIHDTSADNISFAAAHYLTVRGNTLSFPGYPNAAFVREAVAVCEQGAASNFMLIEYNNMSHVADYINSEGDSWIVRNNIMGPIDDTDYGGVPHADGFQANVATVNVFFSDNWHINNAFTDAHLAITSFSGADFWTLRRNVSVRSGDTVTVLLGPGDNIIGAHNNITDVSLVDGGSATPIWARGGGNAGTAYVWKNNAFYNAPDTSGGRPFQDDSGSGQLTWDHNIGFPFFTGAGGTDLNEDPEFVSYAGLDLRPLVSSPMVEAGGALTTTTDSGTGATITVANARWFTDGMGIAEGDKIYIGDDNNLTVTVVDYGANTITLSAEITWSSSQNVGYAYRGSGPDMGVYEYGDTLLTAATISANGTTYTVTPTGDTRGVWFYTNGIPSHWDYIVPYQATLDHTVTAKACALHAQATSIVIAETISDNSIKTKLKKGIRSLRNIFRISGLFMFPWSYYGNLEEDMESVK